MSLLHVDSVIKSYRHKQVLTDVFISCKSGEIVGLLGRNGSGKSTLLKVIFGSLLADNKFIRINDQPLAGRYANHNQIKYLPQHHFLPSHLKIKKVISLFCDRKHAEVISENFRIKPLLEKKCAALSGGEKRLIEIFLIIFSQAEFILLDEPFSGIAPVYREEVKELIKDQSEDKDLLLLTMITGISQT
jgi:ABC-type multidrug transport system ATPase subunit